MIDPFDEYLRKNKAANRAIDFANIRAAGASFDPLETTEPDTNENDVTIDLLTEESRNTLLMKLKGKSLVVDNAKGRPTSETSADQGLVLVRKIGKKLQCRHCGHSWIFSGKLSRYYTGCPRCHSSIRINPLPKKTGHKGAKY